MKHLNDFSFFDWTAFAKDKTFEVLSCNPWKDNDGKFFGTKVETVIKEDHTQYQLRKDEVSVTNQYEKITFKVTGDSLLDIPVGSIVAGKNVKATIYGDYRNQISVKCSDVDIIRPVRTSTPEKVEKK